MPMLIQRRQSYRLKWQLLCTRRAGLFVCGALKDAILLEQLDLEKLKLLVPEGEEVEGVALLVVLEKLNFNFNGEEYQNGAITC
uniref:Uncharacterized protein MANES_12G118300 n=1 Tax=Rhizophora mucronata TaxID=61149 RepID=A0A2P2LY23_RHIMU